MCSFMWGEFFCINRLGKLELRKYGVTPVMEIDNRHRLSSSFSDFITRYTAVSSTNMKTQTAEYYALDPDDGLTMNLGVNPLMQFGLKETRETLCRNILNDISVVEYVPFDSDTIGNLSLDLGDVLKFVGGQADDSKFSAITFMNCKIGGKQSLKGVGKNPKLAQAKSKNDKNISDLLNQIEAGKIGIHTFTNASAFAVMETETKIISIEFATSEDNYAQEVETITEENMVTEAVNNILGLNPMGAYFSETEYDSGGVWTGNLMYSITFKNSSVWIKKVELIMKKKNRVIHKCSNL